MNELFNIFLDENDESKRAWSHRVNPDNADILVTHFTSEIADKLKIYHYHFNEIELRYEDFQQALLDKDKFLYHHYHFMIDNDKALTFLVRKTNNQKYSDSYDSRDEYFEIIPKKVNPGGTEDAAKIVQVTFSSNEEFLLKFEKFIEFETGLVALGIPSTKCVIHAKHSLNSILAQHSATEYLKFQFALIKDCSKENDDDPLCLMNQFNNNRITFISSFYKGTSRSVSIDIGYLQP